MMKDTTMDKSSKSLADKKTKVKVTADPGTAGRLVDWSYDARFDNGGGSNPSKNVMKFDKDSGSHQIIFTLDDNTGFDLKFYPQPHDAMWVAVGTNCPPPCAGDGGGEILFTCVSQDRDVLTVINRNEAEGDLCYALRFDGKRQLDAPPFVFDPIMTNGGGGRISG